MERMKFGWLSPEGKLYECPYCCHSELADKLVGKYKINKFELIEKYDILTEDDMLLFCGWVKIGKDNSTGGYSVVLPEDIEYGLRARIAKLKDEQKQYLKHMYDKEPEKFTGIWFQIMMESGILN